MSGGARSRAERASARGGRGLLPCAGSRCADTGCCVDVDAHVLASGQQEDTASGMPPPPHGRQDRRTPAAAAGGRQAAAAGSAATPQRKQIFSQTCFEKVGGESAALLLGAELCAVCEEHMGDGKRMWQRYGWLCEEDTNNAVIPDMDARDTPRQIFEPDMKLRDYRLDASNPARSQDVAKDRRSRSDIQIRREMVAASGMPTPSAVANGRGMYNAASYGDLARDQQRAAAETALTVAIGALKSVMPKDCEGLLLAAVSRQILQLSRTAHAKAAAAATVDESEMQELNDILHGLQDGLLEQVGMLLEAAAVTGPAIAATDGVDRGRKKQKQHMIGQVRRSKNLQPAAGAVPRSTRETTAAEAAKAATKKSAEATADSQIRPLLVAGRQWAAQVRGKRPVERRPLLSMVARDPEVTRESIELLLGPDDFITEPEWTAARLHALWPGLNMPVEKTATSTMGSVKTEILDRLFEFLNRPAEGCLQRTAYGVALIEYCNGSKCAEVDGKTLPLPCVSTAFIAKTVPFPATLSGHEATQHPRHHGRLPPRGGLGVTSGGGRNRDPDQSVRCPGAACAMHWGLIMLMLSGRCKCCNDRDRRQCLNDITDGPCKKHKWTPKGSMSERAVRALVETLTVGQMLSMAGIDDINQIKGSNNFANMRATILQLCSIAGTDPAGLLESVNAAEDFHKAAFYRHLGHDAQHACQCLTCGFGVCACPGDSEEGSAHEEDDEEEKTDLPDPMGGAAPHTAASCFDCASSAGIFHELRALVEVGRGRSQGASLEATENLDEAAGDIAEYEKNFHDYRAHLALKRHEADFDAEEMRNLGPDEVIVVCDWVSLT